MSEKTNSLEGFVERQIATLAAAPLSDGQFFALLRAWERDRDKQYKIALLLIWLGMSIILTLAIVAVRNGLDLYRALYTIAPVLSLIGPAAFVAKKYLIKRRRKR